MTGADEVGTPQPARGLTRRRLLRDAAVAGTGSLMLGSAPVLARLGSRRQSVAVLGGGVAGMSAAHELSERGFDVTVYERRALGGKARSMGVPKTASQGRLALPGEHGARAVFGWYRNLPDLLSRVPDGRGTVHDNLVVSPKIVYARDGGRPDWAVPTHLSPEPWTPAQVAESLLAMLQGSRVPPDELAYIVSRIVVFLSSSDTRRLGQWERTTWWDFIAADQFSDDYGKLFSDAIAGPLMAAKPREKAARAMGLPLEGLVYSLLGRTTGPVARIFDAPTNEAWIDPWGAYLRSQGVRFVVGEEVVGLDVENGRIAAARLRGREGRRRRVEADWFILAVPAERVPRLLGPRLLAADPSLGEIRRMVTNRYHGVQFYLRRRTPIVNGHLLYTDSPWGLVSVSQAQFWLRDFAATYGDGSVRDCLSVDIGNFSRPGIVYGRPASALRRPHQIVREVWEQLKAHLNDTGEEKLRDGDVHSWFIDPGLAFRDGRSTRSEDQMFISTPGIWRWRPEVTTRIRNLFLAADYVRVPSDISTMDGANEAARRAVGALIDRAGSAETPPPVLPPHRPAEWEALKLIDERRYRSGQPNLFDLPAGAEALGRLGVPDFASRG